MDIYQHFRKDEYPFIDQVLSWFDSVEKRFRPKLTDFLDPREQDIIQMLVGSEEDDLQLKLNGGSSLSEQKRAVIAPFYEEITEADFELVLMESTFPARFVSITHRDVLGAFLSLGLKRQKLGDVMVGDGLFQMVLTKDIADYVMINLEQVKHASVQLREIPFSQMIDIKQEWLEQHHIVPSLRLDVIIKEMYKLSRKQAADLIKSGRVKVNFKYVDDIAFNVWEGDMLSVRGKGRSKLLRINGHTKKEKIKIDTAVLQF